MSYYITNKELSRMHSYLRLVFTQSQYIQEFKISKRIKQKGNKYLYKCDGCGKLCTTREFQIDHINSVVPIGKKYYEMTIQEFYDRLFAPPEELQLLCKDTCHHTKTQMENKERKNV